VIPEAEIGTDFGALAARVPPAVRFGTSSWNYPGWRGLVYHRDYEGKGTSSKMLEEYAAFPLFRTVGIDSSFYAPPTEETLRGWARHLPPGFPCVSKVWDQITVQTHSKARSPARAGQSNPDFLNPDVFLEAVYEPYQRYFADHAGPFVFEFQNIQRRSGIGPAEFAERLDAFFSALPREGSYAVEIRNEEFLTPTYFAVLREHGWPTCSTPGPGCRRSATSSTCRARCRPSSWPGTPPHRPDLRRGGGRVRPL
jgi:uncharacterized protein YecE (DUF72 family)